MGAIVQVSNLSKEFKVPVREPGLRAGLNSLIRREFRAVEAVKGVTFEITEGEIVGFLGPNGAGKTTTLKMLAGLLHPSDGKVEVMGFTPWRREKPFLRRVNMVMGNRHQLGCAYAGLFCTDAHNIRITGTGIQANPGRIGGIVRPRRSVE